MTSSSSFDAPSPSLAMQDSKGDQQEQRPQRFLDALAAGGFAGLMVDVTLFPIDTIKTRLQSRRGFWQSGGFTGIYKGLAPAAAGSVPTAALFFCAYEGLKEQFSGQCAPSERHSPYIHMAAASCAETLACLIRVPVEIAKQRSQAAVGVSGGAIHILRSAYHEEGLVRGLYRGFGTTIFREVPFSIIQFPLWEYLKLHWSGLTGLPLSPAAVAACGALAGAFAAALTTPLDVVKTRVMLAEHSSSSTAQQLSRRRTRIHDILTEIYRERGFRGFFAGLVPRVIWITLGGAVFFGSYDLMLTRLL